MNELYEQLPPTLDDTAPSASAITFLKRRKHPLIVWRGDLYEWTGRNYEKRSKEEVKAEIRHFLDSAITPAGLPFRSTIKRVDEVVAATRQAVLIPDRFEVNTNIKDGTPMNAISCHNGLLNLTTGVLSPHSSEWLVLNTLPFGYDPTLPEPTEWLKFINSLWPDDPVSITTLQEMLGYLVSGATDQQKIFLLLGPKRCGKGTISHVIRELVGDPNYVGVPFANIPETFGLATLIGKSIMVVPDARPTGIRNLSTITERLLSISGEDPFSTQRKYLDNWNGALSVRIVILSNVIPRLPDTSGAIASRFVPIKMTISFYGREDRTLKTKLHVELPQIFNWALDGLRRLNKRGFFIIPESAQELLTEVEDAAAPHRIFIRETLLEDPDGFVTKDQVYGRYRVWCDQYGHHPSSATIFYNNLRTEFPMMQECRPRTPIAQEGGPAVGAERPRGWKGIRYWDPNDGETYVVPDPISEILAR